MSRLTQRLAHEQGWALVSSVIVLGILLSLTIPLLSLVDTQQRQATHERKSESSFNLAEAAFDAGVFVLSNEWPVKDLGAYPKVCDAASTSLKCPDDAILAQTYTGPDYSASGWTVRFRDDGTPAGGDYYDADKVDAQPTYDANGNAQMWVRADAHASGRDRTVVALVKRQDRLEPFPRNAVTAGWFATSGGHTRIVDTKGAAGQPAPLAVRCTSSVPPPSPGCLDYQPANEQVTPDTAYTGYVGDTAIPDEALQRFREKANALHSYYPSGCPQVPAGELVFIESGNCGFAGGGEANSPDSPGMLIVAHGTISFSGNMSYYGLVYAANGQRSTGALVDISGAATVFGSVAVDWGGGITAGNNGNNLVFDDRVFPLLKSFGSAATVQGTWRELPAS